MNELRVREEQQPPVAFEIKRIGMETGIRGFLGFNGMAKKKSGGYEGAKICRTVSERYKRKREGKERRKSDDDRSIRCGGTRCPRGVVRRRAHTIQGGEMNRNPPRGPGTHRNLGKVGGPLRKEGVTGTYGVQTQSAAGPVPASREETADNSNIHGK